MQNEWYVALPLSLPPLKKTRGKSQFTLVTSFLLIDQLDNKNLQ